MIALLLSCLIGQSADEPSLAMLSADLARGAVTSRALTERFLARIREHDPRLRSVIELNPQALEQAAAADARHKSGTRKGPLDGVPLLIKDNIATHDAMSTSAGSLALADFKAPEDAEIVRRLREAGVVLLGKTNLSEWANIRSAFSTSGWSARGGQTRNPYALDRTPIGSSSGSGAAAAASLAAAAIGTETDGSIVAPASVNCLVGLKPTVGLVSRYGIIPISPSQDTAGPMTRTVEDAAILLDVLAGPDARDPVTQRAPARPASYAQGLDPGALRGARIGVLRPLLFGKNRHADAIAEAALAKLREAGAVIVDPVDAPSLNQLGNDELLVLLYELKESVDAYLGRFGAAARVHSLADVVRFNEEHAAEELSLFGQDLFVAALAHGPGTRGQYRAALARNVRRARSEGIDRLLRRHKLDALFGPTSGPPGLIDPVGGDYGFYGASSPAAVAGYPHVTVPGGFVSGLPVGVSFFGAAWSEAKLLKLAFAFEQATKHRRAPELLPTARTPGAASLSPVGR